MDHLTSLTSCNQVAKSYAQFKGVMVMFRFDNRRKFLLPLARNSPGFASLTRDGRLT